MHSSKLKTYREKALTWANFGALRPLSKNESHLKHERTVRDRVINIGEHIRGSKYIPPDRYSL